MAEESPAAKYGTLKVIGTRQLSDEEYKPRIVDFIGADHIVRLRYEAPTANGVFIYAPYGQIEGYSPQRAGTVVRWAGFSGSHSPGFKEAQELFGKADRDKDWLYLPSRAAVEWQYEIVPTNTGEEDAKSIFVKENRSDEPQEIISTWYRPSAGPRRRVYPHAISTSPSAPGWSASQKLALAQV